MNTHTPINSSLDPLLFNDGILQAQMELEHLSSKPFSSSLNAEQEWRLSH